MAGPSMPFGSVYEVTTKAKGKDVGEIININHFQFPDTVVTNQGDLFVFLANWALFWETLVVPNLSAFYEVTLYTVKEIVAWKFVGGFKRLVYNLTAVQPGNGGTDVGGIVTDGLPNYAAFTVQKKSTFAGRSFKGSMRIGGVVEADTDENDLQPAAIVWMDTAFQTLIDTPINVDAAATQTIEWAIFSPTRFFANVLFQEPATAEPRTEAVRVASKVVNPKVGSQLSRKIRNF